MREKKEFTLVINRKYSWYTMPYKDNIKSGFLIGYLDYFPVFKTKDGAMHIVPLDNLIIY